MTEVIRLVGIGIALAVTANFLRNNYSTIAIQMGLAFLVLTLIFMLPFIAEVIRFIRDLGQHGGVKELYLDVILKCIGIAYIASIGAQLAQDAGEQNIAVAIEFAGKILILVIALPIISGVLASLLSIFP